MQKYIIIGVLIFIARIIQDIFFLGKIDAFNRSSRTYMLIMNFVDALYGILVIKFVIDYINISILYAVIFGMGSAVGGLIIMKLKSRINHRLAGQKKFFVRVSSTKDLSGVIQKLKNEHFIFSVEKKKFTDGKTRTILEGGVIDIKRRERVKQILKGRKIKHIVIIRADEMYVLRRRL